MMDGEWTNPPFTFMLRDKSAYASITEGALVNYSGMVFQADATQALHARLGHAEPATFGFRSRYGKDTERLSHAAVIDGPITTPWRIVMIGADLNALVNCDIVHNVSAPPDPKLFPDGLKTDWIKPGRSVWAFLDGGDRTVEGQKEFAGLGQQLGFEYNVIEGFWRSWPESQLKELVDYSRAARRETASSGASAASSRTRRRHARSCSTFAAASAWRECKIDFFDHENKEVIDLYEMTGESRRGAQADGRFSWRQQAHRPGADLSQHRGDRSRPRDGVLRPVCAARCDPAVHPPAGRDGAITRPRTLARIWPIPPGRTRWPMP